MNSEVTQYKNAQHTDSHVQTDCIYCSCEDMKELGESEASATELAVNSLSLIFLKKQPSTRILTRYICD